MTHGWTSLSLALLTGLLVSAQRTRPAPTPFFEDSFDGTGLDPSWRVLHPDLATVSVTNGALRIAPNQGGLATIWYQDAEGALVYRNVTGDFTATARVHARLPGSALPPPVSYRLGGILARRPGSTAGDRDSVHVALGAGVPTMPVCAEDKTTVDSVSDFLLHPIPSADGELRLRRRGARFSMAWRPFGVGPWMPLRSHLRPDLPATLQVGLMAYSADASANLELRFDRFRLEP